MKYTGTLLICVASAAVAPLCGAFALTSTGHRLALMTNAIRPSCSAHGLILHMSETEGESEVKADVASTAPKTGTFYDDEVDPIPVTKKDISDNMRARLIREASTGLDSNQKQTNVLLYIMLGVAVLVILGGQGILY